MRFTLTFMIWLAVLLVAIQPGEFLQFAGVYLLGIGMTFLTDTVRVLAKAAR